ncbi:MAG: 6-bladed beta-propeller, partial [Gemmatimonadota bacterium]
GKLRRPMHLELVGDSLLYVPEYLNDRIQRFHLDGAPAGTIAEDTVTAEGLLDAPGGVAVVPEGDEVWIADFFHHRVAVYGRDGRYRRRVGSSGRGVPGRLHYPTDVAFGPDGTAYVADAYNHRIQRFSRDGRRLDSWGGPLGLGLPGPWKGWFSVATGVHVDARGRVFVADFYNDRVQVFGPAGDFVAEWGGAGSGDGAFDRPTDTATGPGGRVYVVDFGNDRIQVFTCPSC